MTSLQVIQKPDHGLQERSRMAKLLVIDDDPLIRRLFTRVYQNSWITVVTAASAEEGLAALSTCQPDVVILDVLLPDLSGLEAFQRIVKIDGKLPVIFVTSDEASDKTIEAMKLGALDYLLKPLDFRQVRPLVDRAIEMSRLMKVPVQITHEAKPEQLSSDCLIGRCPAMQEVYKEIGRVAPQDDIVLICGESGTGKELLARAIYQHSQRSEGPFLAINCAAIPESLLESELFGHEKGAFTGADCQRIGKFEQCSGGTLFLDEIGDMTPITQSKILRIIETQCFQRIGGNETVKTDVRIIAATNRDLEQMIVQNRFRADLYYRLSVFEIELPPLRRRADDLQILLEHFLHRFNRVLGKDVQGVSPDALEILRSYQWPGNVRELQSVLKQALLRATGPVIVPDFLPDTVKTSRNDLVPADSNSLDLRQFVRDRLQAGCESLYAECLSFMERHLIMKVLRQTSGNQAHAAKILGITRGSLRNKIHALDITVNTVIKSNGKDE